MTMHVRALLRMAGLTAAATVASAALAGAQIAKPDVSRELQTAKAVLATPQWKAAMDYVNSSDDDLVRDWLSVCNAFGPSMDEIYRSRLIHKLFRIYGLDNVHIDDAKNVIGVRKGTGGGPTVVLNAHHDNTALMPKDQPIEAFVADGRVWCPGGGDGLRGTAQLLSVLRAMNAAQVKTKGDVWFATFTGEESGSPGAEHFVRANYPLNLDWKKGDIMVQFHGGAGDGVSSGSSNYIHFTQLRIFTPLNWPRWRTDAVDALAPLMTRINKELRDSRSLEVEERGSGSTEALTGDILYMNMSMVQGDPIINGTADEAWVRIDMRSPSEQRLWTAHKQIQKIADDVMKEMGPGFTYTYEINMTSGTPGIDGWDKVNNAPTKMALAAAQALYGGTPTVDPTRGCGDCGRAYMTGMPMLSFRGNVTDYQKEGRFSRESTGGLKSKVRLRDSGHDVSDGDGEIVSAWAGIKQGLLFAISYAGMSN